MVPCLASIPISGRRISGEQVIHLMDADHATFTALAAKGESNSLMCLGTIDGFLSAAAA